MHPVRYCLLFVGLTAFAVPAGAQILNPPPAHPHEHHEEAPQPDLKDLYPAAYTFGQARTFELKGEAEKAAWIYINLYAGNQAGVKDSIMALGRRQQIASLPDLVRSSFAKYAPSDPSISHREKDGVLNLDMEKLQLRGQQAEALMRELGYK